MPIVRRAEASVRDLEERISDSPAQRSNFLGEINAVFARTISAPLQVVFYKMVS